MATGQAPHAGEDFKRLTNLMLFGFRAGPKRYRKLLVFQCFGFGIFILFWIKFNGGNDLIVISSVHPGLVPSFLFSQPPKDISSDVDVLDHFQVEKDGSRVSWAHAVNSQSSLQRALNSEALMLEADVLLKGQNTDQQQLVAIMAQPPAVTSDIALEEWLQQASASGKGLKLDFKSIEVVDISLQKLHSLKKQLQVPIFLHADILEGPNADTMATKTMDPQRFLRLCNSVFPDSTLSLGWTSGSPSIGGVTRYDWATVKDMHDLVEKWNLKQPLSFSVRASLARNSLPQLKWLIEMTGATLTVWSPQEDQVPVMDLLLLRHKFPRHKVFYDLHESLNLEFQPVRDEAEARLTEEDKSLVASTFKADKWKVVKTKVGEVIYLGNEAVLLQKGLLVTKEMYASPFSISGRVEFLPMMSDDIGSTEPGVEMFVLVTQSSRPDTLSGIKCFIGVSGTLRISTQGIPGVDRQVEGSVTGATPCFSFTISNQGGSHLTMSVFRQSICGVQSKAHDSESTLELAMSTITQGAGHVAIKTASGQVFVAVDHFSITSV